MGTTGAEAPKFTQDILKVEGNELVSIDETSLKVELLKLNILVVGAQDIFDAFERKRKSYRGRRDIAKLWEDLNMSFKTNKQEFLDKLGIVTLKDAQKNQAASQANIDALKNKASIDAENTKAQAQATAQEQVRKEAQAKAQRETQLAAESARSKIDGVGWVLSALTWGNFGTTRR